jgi:hypothetical protein
VRTHSSASALKATWSNRLGTVLTPIATGVWAAERPFTWNNIDVGGRCSIMRIPSKDSKDDGALGGLAVYSPVELTDSLAGAIEDLGSVKVIICPNYEHLKYAKQWEEAYPNAEMWACPGLAEYSDEMGGIQWSRKFGFDDDTAFVGQYGLDICWFDCEINPFTRKPFFNEVVVFHKGSRSLCTADMYWNYPATKHPNYNLLSGTGELHQCSKVPVDATNCPEIEVPFSTSLWKFGMDKVFLPFFKNFMVGKKRRDRLIACSEKVMKWSPLNIVPCHGDVVKGQDLCAKELRRQWQ